MLLATARLERPVPHASTMRERWASACAVFGRRAHSFSRSRSSAAKLKGAIGLPVRIRVPPPIRRTLADHNLFNVFITQNTRGACETDRGRGEARPRLRPEAYLTP